MSARFDTKDIRNWAPMLRAGEELLLSGTVYTARDAAHKRMAALLAANKPLPFPLDGAAIYYAGPTPARVGAVCGSFGPTTSGRMDAFAPALYDLGLGATIGKGNRSAAVVARYPAQSRRVSRRHRRRGRHCGAPHHVAGGNRLSRAGLRVGQAADLL